jgi:hypothetical protein
MVAAAQSAVSPGGRLDFLRQSREFVRLCVTVDVCGARRANSKGAVESRNHFLAR